MDGLCNTQILWESSVTIKVSKTLNSSIPVHSASQSLNLAGDITGSALLWDQPVSRCRGPIAPSLCEQ